MAPLPGGEIAVTLLPRERPWVVGADGRMHALPRVRGLLTVASAPDGTLLAASSSHVSRLRADRSGWDVVLDARASVPRWSGADEIELLAAFPGGGFAFTSDRTRVSRVDAAGAVERVRLPPETEAQALAAAPSGELVVAVENSGGDTRLMAAAPGAPLHALTGFREVAALGLAALPDGTLLRAGGVLDVLGPDGPLLARLGHGAPPGSGDGGAGSDAGTGLGAFGVAAAPDGAVLVTEFAAGGFERMTVGSRGEDLLLGLFAGSGTLTMPLRVFAAPGTARPLAAVAAPTRQRLALGEVSVESTVPGDATVVVRRRGREVARAGAALAAGRSVVRLPAPPPEGDLTVTVEVTAADGRLAGDRLEVSTYRRLRDRVARGAIRRASRFLSFSSDDREYTSGCRRTGARRYACRIRRGGGARCVGRVVVTQRSEGRVIRIRRGC